MKYIPLVIAAASACLVAAPVLASDCSLTDISPTAILCSGGYTGNVLNNSPADVATQQAGLLAIGFVWDGTNFDAFPKVDELHGATDIDFGWLMHGITFVGVHVGGGAGGGQTTFYKFDAGSALETFTLHLPSSSDAVLYSTGRVSPPVPEPASWAMMLGGFGAIGGMIRSRRKATVSFG